MFDYLPIYKFPDFAEVDFEKISDGNISRFKLGSEYYLKIEYEDLQFLAKKCFSEINYFFSKSHLKKLSSILNDKEASSNDRFVARKLIENAVVASSKIFPLCQDTGTASIIAEKGNLILSGFDEKKALTHGIYETYTNENLRYSQLVPSSLFKEQNSGNNLPAQIDIYSGKGHIFKFLCVAKGGGSSNKTFFYTENKSILDEKRFKSFLESEIRKIGTAACPPYHLGIVVGGTSPEMNLKTLKLTTSGALDYLDFKENKNTLAIRDKKIEEFVYEFCKKTGAGAQYGGKYFCLDNKVVRLPRHGASVFIGIGVSCYAHRNQFAYIDDSGIYMEKKEKNPASYLPDTDISFESPVKIDLDRPMAEIRNQLSALEISTPLLLTGNIVVARDIAHAKLKENLRHNGELPEYFKKHPVYYAGPAKIPEGYASGSFGPTTSARMDSYVEEFQEKNASLVMIGKGNRSDGVSKSCKKHGGFYLGAIGGAAALVGKNCIEKVEVIDFKELGMEAVFKIRVKNFPAFLVTDDKGNDFFNRL